MLEKIIINITFLKYCKNEIYFLKTFLNDPNTTSNLFIIWNNINYAPCIDRIGAIK